MMDRKKPYTLDRMLLRQLLFRLFLPLLAVGLAAIGGACYFGVQALITRQNQVVQSLADRVDNHLEQGGRILDAIAGATGKSTPEDLAVFMQSTRNASGHFETIYLLDGDDRISLIVPYEPRYIGLDMSRLSDIRQTGETNHIIISRPFISLRTGDPTVYLSKPLPNGGRVVGELNLGAFQEEIMKGRGPLRKDSIFILDQSGTLLAHPVSNMVKQQTNLGWLKIFQIGLNKGEASFVYDYSGARVLGCASRVKRVGWVVVDQIPFSVLLGPYALTLGITFMASLGIWWMLEWNLRRKVRRNIITPLVQLSRGTDAVAAGDYSQSASLSPLPGSFMELNNLAEDFLYMSKMLQVREEALRTAQQQLIREEKLSILGRLAGVVGHEIRNPLGVMNNAVYFLKTVLASSDDPVKEYLDIIKNEIDKAQRIITDLLDFARTKTPQPKAVVIRELVTEALGRCTIPEVINVLIDIPETMARVNADPFQVVQVFQNLIANAVQAMPGEGALKIAARQVHPPSLKASIFVKTSVDRSARQAGSPAFAGSFHLRQDFDGRVDAADGDKVQGPDNAGDRRPGTRDFGSKLVDQGSESADPRPPNPSPCFVEVSVSDTGSGISPENMKKLFQPLFTTKAKGIGLGLVVCKNLVEANGGRITVESVLEKGTTFIITLPVTGGCG